MDYDRAAAFIWFDGRLVPTAEVFTHCLSHSLLFGGAVFDGMRVYDGRIHKVRQHVSRLLEGARLSRMHIDWGEEEIASACAQMVSANGLSNAYIRPEIWRDAGSFGISPKGAKAHIAIAAWALEPSASLDQRMRGLRLDVARWRRPAPDSALVTFKSSGMYPAHILAREEAEERGFDDALMLDQHGFVAEATGANIFFVIDGKLHTPTADCFLNGVTRQTVLEIAADRSIEFVERSIPLGDVARASEAFLTGTSAEITPLRQIGDVHFVPAAMCELFIDEYAVRARAPE
jgi:branched-chain amino acid aminotransferase